MNVADQCPDGSAARTGTLQAVASTTTVRVNVVPQRGEPLCPLPPCCLTYLLNAVRRLGPALCPAVVTVERVSLGQPLPSTTSAADAPALFGGFVGTTELSDFLRRRARSTARMKTLTTAWQSAAGPVTLRGPAGAGR